MPYRYGWLVAIMIGAVLWQTPGLAQQAPNGPSPAAPTEQANPTPRRQRSQAHRRGRPPDSGNAATCLATWAEFARG